MGRVRRFALGSVAALWAAAMALLFALPRPPFDLEAYLLRQLPPLHLDAYAHVNDLITPPLSAILVSWLSASIALLVARRSTLLLVNVLGPVVGAAMVTPSIDFADPEWCIVGAVITIGCLVGLVVTGACWVHDRFCTRRAGRSQE
jgi:hypothetical protein